MSTVPKRKTYKEAMLDIRDKYRQAGMRWPALVRDIATWAINEGLWEAPVELAITKCTQDMARALKEEHHTDLQGRKGVRTNVAALLPYLDEDENEKQININRVWVNGNNKRNC
ncbi:hypothetical protein LCGC14_2627310 [marine sediment metagenome]|uniref:Uncharacterized protein n=1 Tax=marine sediment metagenome TaxID=412755 RepID=A0A0F9ANX7_9ZZZZ